MSTTRPKTKVVIRNLPPGMTEDTFKSVLENLASGRYTWLSYFPGKVSLKRVLFSRAYVNFVTAEDVFEFKQRFDGHVFIGQKGHQYRCSVEYAPLQKVPVQEDKPHPLEGTLDKDPEYLAFLEAYEAGQLPPGAAYTGTSAVEVPSAAASTVTEGGEGKVVMSRLMEYLVRKYTEGGNRLGGMRAATKVKQSMQDLVEHVQVPAREGRGAAGAKAAKAAAAAAAATAAAAVTAAVTGDTSGTKGSRKERDRSSKGALSDVPSTKSAEKQRGGTGKGSRGSASEATAEAAMPTFTLLTKASGPQATPSKRQAKELAVEKSSGSGAGRSDARLSQACSRAAASTDAEGVAAPTQEVGKGRGGAGMRTSAQGQVRGTAAAAQEDVALVARPIAAATPRLLLVKGGEARLTQAASSGEQPAPAQPVPTAPAARSATAKKTSQESQGARQQQQQQQSRSNKQQAAALQHGHEDACGSVGGAATQTAAQPAKGTKTHATVPALAGDRGTGKSPSASVASTGPKTIGPAPTPATSASGAPGPSDAVAAAAAPDGLVATASAAATAALTAATLRPSGKKVRAGFQMYVPGSLRGRTPGAAAAGINGTGEGAAGESSTTG